MRRSIPTIEILGRTLKLLPDKGRVSRSRGKRTAPIRHQAALRRCFNLTAFNQHFRRVNRCSRTTPAIVAGSARSAGLTFGFRAGGSAVRIRTS